MPSVEGWGTDNAILRSPPKGVFTRRIDKVGQTSEIVEMLDASENRFAECILPFARGVNPSVSVSYQNHVGAAAQTQASLPYRLSDSFRPPVMTQYNLQPLSRLPRVWTSSFTKPGFADFSKKMRSCGPNDITREVKKDILSVSAIPNAVYKIETPAQAPYEVKYIIQNDQVGASQRWTAPKTTNATSQIAENWKSGAETHHNPLRVSAQTGVGSSAHAVNEFTGQFNADPFMSGWEYTSAESGRSRLGDVNVNNTYENYGALHTQEALQASVATNARMPGTTRIEDLGNNTQSYTKAPLYTDYQSQAVMMTGKTLDADHDLELARTLPAHTASTNIKRNLEKSITHEYQIPHEVNRPVTEAYSGKSVIGDAYRVVPRGARLTPTLSFGDFESKPMMPHVERMQSQIQSSAYESDRSVMSKKVGEMFSRYERPR